MKVYLDVCCLSRLTDDQSQSRIRAEAGAVEGVLRLIHEGLAQWVSGTILEIEAGRNPDPDRRHDALSLLAFATTTIVPTQQTAERANRLERIGFSSFDALHLASAEQGEAEVFLTTDDDLIRRAARHRNEIHVSVQNPLSWYQQVAQ